MPLVSARGSLSEMEAKDAGCFRDGNEPGHIVAGTRRVRLASDRNQACKKKGSSIRWPSAYHQAEHM